MDQTLTNTICAACDIPVFREDDDCYSIVDNLFLCVGCDAERLCGACMIEDARNITIRDDAHHHTFCCSDTDCRLSMKGTEQ